MSEVLLSKEVRRMVIRWRKIGESCVMGDCCLNVGGLARSRDLGIHCVARRSTLAVRDHWGCWSLRPERDSILSFHHKRTPIIGMRDSLTDFLHGEKEY